MATANDDDGQAPSRLARNFDMILLHSLNKKDTQIESLPLWALSVAGRKALYSSKRDLELADIIGIDSSGVKVRTPSSLSRSQARQSRVSSVDDLGLATGPAASQSATPETVGSSTFGNATKSSGTPETPVADQGLSKYATTDYVSHEINGTTFYHSAVVKADEDFRLYGPLKLSLLEQLLGDIRCEDVRLLRSPSSAAVAKRPVHVFIDLSNIHIGWLNAFKHLWGLEDHVRLGHPFFDFFCLDHIFVRGREVAKRVLAGSVSARATSLPGYMVQAEALGYEMNIFRRVVKEAIPRGSYSSPSDASADERAHRAATKFSEQGVDEILHLKMLQSLVDCGGEPGTIVLATGDAREAQFSDGFKANIVRLLEAGWMLELCAWSRQLSVAWEEKSFMHQWKHQMRVIRLDQFGDVLIPRKPDSPLTRTR